MSILDVKLTDVPFAELEDHVGHVKDYLRRTAQPNAVSATGDTAVSIALRFCNTEDGIQILRSLLDSGGNPNLPNPLRNFLTYTTVATTLVPLRYMSEAGLELNCVFAPKAGILMEGERPLTLLDYVCDIREYLNRNRGSLAPGGRLGFSLLAR